MEELDHGLKVSVRGEEAEDAIRRALDQIGEWELIMPDVEPLVLDFGLGDFDRIGEIEFWIANEVDAGYCGKYLFLFEGQTCPAHSHKQKLETFFLVKGRISVTYQDRNIELEQGATLLIERGAAHEFTALEASLLLEVSTPSIIDDNFFKDSHIPIGGNYSGGG
jgi:quercetin dioxygenase-like cupin family protein